MTDDAMFAPLPGGGSRRSRAGRGTEGWQPVVPVPADAPAAPGEHPTRGHAVATWEYRDSKGGLLGYVYRFDGPNGSKDFIPLTWNRHGAREVAEWRWRSWDVPRPLYGLDRLAARPEAPVLVCEGEKAADAAGGLLPGFVTVTSPNGAKSSSKGDWRPLAHRRVVIWPDADKAGDQYAEDAARALLTLSADVAIITPPSGVKAGWDAADALAEGWDEARALALIETARPAAAAMSATHGNGDPPGVDGGVSESNLKGRGISQSARLVGFADGVELWHNPDGEPFATVPVAGHQEHFPIRGRAGGFRRWLAGLYYDDCDGAPSAQAMEDAFRIFEVLAARGPEHLSFTRVGELGGAIYLDLGDAAWRAVKVTGQGWEVVDRPAVKFLRNSAMRGLPEPERGESVDVLRPFFNCASEGDFRLLIGWLVGSLRPNMPYAIMTIAGEQGSAKSTLALFLRQLIDPRAAGLRALPRDERDLAIAADNSWVLAFDNLSGIAAWVSDALCRLSTGSGFATRELHSDRDESVFEAKRPLILNGITDLAARADLADRAVAVTLKPISKENRRAELELLRSFDEVWPLALGALLDAVVSALAHIEEVQLDGVERMADFSKWVTAAEPGLGWHDGAFAEAYDANRAAALEISIEHDPVASAVWEIMKSRAVLEGSATELLPIIEERVSSRIKESRKWTGTPAWLGGQLSRAAPVLRRSGLEVDSKRSGGRLWTFRNPQFPEG